jgi:hypothetical protein
MYNLSAPREQGANAGEAFLVNVRLHRGFDAREAW